MYEDVVGQVRRGTEAALRESQARVDLAVRRTEEADRRAAEAGSSVGARWASRVKALRRRVTRSNELRLGPEEQTEDELVTLFDPAGPRPGIDPGADVATPPFGLPEELADEATYGRHAAPDFGPQPVAPEPVQWPTAEWPSEPPPPPRQPPTWDDEDYSNQSWLTDH